MSRYQSEWGAILPAEVALGESEPRSEDVELHPEEEGVAAAFGPHRRSHFAAGRRCARLAMSSLGAGPLAILAEERRPIWPAGWVGSITHTDDYAAAAVARADSTMAVGIDVERRRPMAEGVAERIAHAEERTALPEAGDDGWLTVLFSAKEAFYKLQNPLTNAFLGFLDVRVMIHGETELELELLRPAGALERGQVFRARFHRGAEHVLTAFALPAAGK